MANGAFNFKNNSGNIASFISGSDSDIIMSGGTLNLSSMTGVTLGNLTLSGTTQNAISTSHAASYQLTSSFNTYSGNTNTIIGTLQTSTGSLNTFSSSTNNRLNAVESTDGFLNIFTSSATTRLNSIETTTGSLNTSTGSLNSFTSSAITRLSSIEGVSGSYATTGSNIFRSSQTITGSLFISENLVIAGSSSIQYISSSVVNIDDNIITVNAMNPSVRFGGLAVIDSGSSPQVSGSMLFDSVNNQWVFVHQNQTSVTSSVLLMGPETFNNLGNEAYLTLNRLPKGTGIEHLVNSNITDTGTKVSINSNTEVTGSLIVDGRLGVSTNNLVANLTTKETETHKGLVLFGRSSDNLTRIDFFRSDETTFTGRIQMDNGTNSNMSIRAQGAIQLQTGGSTNRLVIDSAGASTFSSTLSATQYTAQSDSAYYRVRRASGTDVGYITDSSTWGTTGTDFSVGASSANLRFFTNNSVTERMRLDSIGRLGLGTTTPNQKLTVSQEVTGFNQGIPGISGETQNGILRLIPGGGFGEALDFGMNVATTYAWIQSTNFSALNTNYILTLNPNGGNVVIGSTNTGADGLNINNARNLSFSEGSGESYVNIFRQRNSAALVMGQGYKRSLTDGFASSFSSGMARAAIAVGYNNGSIAFFSDPSSTVANGTNITPTERMTLINNGFFGINNATPITQLDVRLSATDNVNGSVANSYPVASFIVNGSGGGQRGIQLGAPVGSISSPTFLKIFGTSARFSIINQSNVENLTVLENGRVGIGLTDPGSVLDVSHNAGTTNIIRVSNGSGNYRWRVDQNFSMVMTNASNIDTFSVNTSGEVQTNSGFQGRYARIFEASAQRGGLYPYNVISGGGTDYSIGLFSEGELYFAPGGSATKRFTMNNNGVATFNNSVTASSFSTSGFIKVNGIMKTFSVSKNFAERLSNVDYFRVSSSGGSGFQVVVYSVSQNGGVGWSGSQIFQASTAPYWGGWVGHTANVNTIGSGSPMITSASVGNDGTITFRVTTGNNGTVTDGTILSYIQITGFNVDNISVTTL